MSLASAVQVLSAISAPPPQNQLGNEQNIKNDETATYDCGVMSGGSAFNIMKLRAAVYS